MNWHINQSGDSNIESKKLTKEHADALFDAAIEKALEGNTRLLKAFLGHLIHRPKLAPINIVQRRILITVMVVIAGMMLYPPYYYPRESNSSGLRHGYDWLLGEGWGRVEVDLLLTQFFAVGIIALIAWVLCTDKKS